MNTGHDRDESDRRSKDTNYTVHFKPVEKHKNLNSPADLETCILKSNT
jgi:hypothetical protein